MPERCFLETLLARANKKIILAPPTSEGRTAEKGNYFFKRNMKENGSPANRHGIIETQLIYPFAKKS